ECTILENYLKQKHKHKEIAKSFVSENMKYITFQDVFQRSQKEIQAQTPR
ncbi:2790_t:CDS:2, partial [Racocetra persica]